MKNITIHSSGIVTGDVGTVIAREGMNYSEPIRFLYPAQFESGNIKKIQYYWGATMCEDMLDSNDCVRIAIQGSGIVRMQFVVVNPINGAVKFTSTIFETIVDKQMGFQKSYNPSCCSSASCGSVIFPPSDSLCQDGCVGNDTDLAIRLDREMQVRAESDNAIWEYLDKIGDNAVLTSPNGSKFKLIVDDDGNLSTTIVN